MIVDQLEFNAPASRARVQRLLASLDLSRDSRVVDVGCGRGEMLAMLAEGVGCRGVGVDPKPDEIERARARTRDLGDRIQWHECRIQDVDCGGGFDAAICAGATHAFGAPGEALRKTLEALRACVRPEGRLLIGEGYWKREPSPEYLAATGMARNDLTSHEANVRLGVELGLVHLYDETSSLEEWDRFEGAFLEAAQQAHRRAPDDQTTRKDLDHWTSWHDAYRRWGRETLGFGFYVFEV
ncbi:MAG: SAM-dependent methyltransferase [Planctomycetota bacterium]|jgi:SAM-dependent methyltransferase